MFRNRDRLISGKRRRHRVEVSQAGLAERRDLLPSDHRDDDGVLR